MLVGDEKQLGPTATSGIAALNTSLYERVLAVGVPHTMLNVQYRMHPSIAVFPSTEFYDAELESGTSQESHGDEAARTLFGGRIRYAFCDVEGQETRGAHNPHSFENKEEAMAVAQRVRALLMAGADAQQIGVITGYQAQVALLYSLLHDERLAGVRVATVDSYQGKERDHIILSFVRCNAQKGTAGVGFFRDGRRLNVALTRARYTLTLIGSASTLSRDERLLKMLHRCRQDGVLHAGLPAGSDGARVWEGALPPLPAEVQAHELCMEFAEAEVANVQSDESTASPPPSPPGTISSHTAELSSPVRKLAPPHHVHSWMHCDFRQCARCGGHNQMVCHSFDFDSVDNARREAADCRLLASFPRHLTPPRRRLRDGWLLLTAVSHVFDIFTRLFCSASSRCLRTAERRRW